MALDRQSGESERAWLERRRDGLLAAEAAIERETGQSHRYLAYPYGEYNLAIKEMLEEEGFVGLAQNSGAAGYHSDFLAVPRYPLASIYANLDTASTKLESLAFNVRQVSPDTPVTSSRSPSADLGSFLRPVQLFTDWLLLLTTANR